MMGNEARASADYRRIEEAIRFLEQNACAQPDLQSVATGVGLSAYHFQRLFRRWVGISPKRFLQYLTLEQAKRLLARSRPLLETALESGLSGPGRLHDLFVTYEAMTPGAFKRKGAGLDIAYGFHPSPFGECLLLATWRGVCGLGFTLEGGREETLAEFRRRWPEASYREEPSRTAPLIGRIFPRQAGRSSLHLLLRGTNFQLKVWEALLRIPAGAVTSYGALAESIGRPRAARAVGRAVADNPIAFVIPCHRVIRETGLIHGYEWGVARKRAILAWEAARFGEDALRVSVGALEKGLAREGRTHGRALPGGV